MLKIEDEYPGRSNASSSDYPGGSFNDKSGSSANEGTPVAAARRLNDWVGAFLGILKKAGITQSGNVETANVSDVTDAIFESQAISNNALAADLTLSKFGQGQMAFSNMVFGAAGLLFGSDGILQNYMVRKGIYMAGSAAPGSVNPYMRWAIFDISTQLAAAPQANANTYTADAHEHQMGTTYSFTSPFNTNIRTSAKIFDAKVSFSQVAGACNAGVTCQVDFDSTGGSPDTWTIDRIIHLRSTATDAIITTNPVYLTIFYDGDYLDP